MSKNDSARPRGAITLEARIRSRRLRDGGLSIFNRIREEAIRNAADAIASSNQYRDLTEDDLVRSLQLWCSHHADSALSTEDQAANLRARRQVEAQPIPVRDINRELLKKMSPRERLDVANGVGLSSRFRLLEPNNE